MFFIENFLVKDFTRHGKMIEISLKVGSITFMLFLVLQMFIGDGNQFLLCGILFCLPHGRYIKWYTLFGFVYLFKIVRHCIFLRRCICIYISLLDIIDILVRVSDRVCGNLLTAAHTASLTVCR